MTENGNQEIDLTQLMQRIREDAQRRKSNSIIDASATLFQLLNTDGPALSQAGLEAFQNSLPGTASLNLDGEFESREQYQLDDLLVFHDATFVRNAYKAVLKRDPDDSGFVQYLRKLREGSRSKIDILGSLRFSPEGRSKEVKIEGLAPRAFFRKVYSVPLLGYVIELLVTMARLPHLVANHRRLEAHCAAQHSELLEAFRNSHDLLSNHIVEAATNVSSNYKKIADLHYQQLKALIREQKEIIEDQNRLKSEVAVQLSAAEEQLKQQAGNQETHEDQLQTLKAQTEKRLQQTTRDLVLQERRVALLLEEARKRLPGPFEPEQLQTLAEEKDHLLDSLFAALEDEFRGTRADIKDLSRFYLPILQDAGVTSGILDIGCGRGEWLEVLKEAGLGARGIDLNRVMIEHCSQMGLDAIESEAVSYLQLQADNSLSAITAFHFAEHLPLTTLIKFLDEALRALRSGGLIILETPNPENLLVGSCNFYLDPTHRNPIPIPTMQLLVESRGFCSLETFKLHAVTSSMLQGEDELTKRFNHYICGPMDYAIAGRKV